MVLKCFVSFAKINSLNSIFLVSSFQIENSHLRSKVTGYNDVTQLIVTSDDLSALARDDILNRYGMDYFRKIVTLMKR